MMHVGGYHDAREGYHPLKFEYHGGYHDACGGYHEYRGVFSTVGYSNNKRLFPPWY